LVGTTTATIANIAPTGNNFRVTHRVVPDGGRNWRVEGFVQDVMPAGDTLDVTIDWGDGSEPTELAGDSTPILSAPDDRQPPCVGLQSQPPSKVSSSGPAQPRVGR
jgi:hypothetical protein